MLLSIRLPARVAAAMLACTVLLSAGALAATPPAAPNAPLPLSTFFDNAAFTGAKLAPNATALAVRVGGPGARDRLAVIDLVNNSIKVVATFTDDDVGEFQWVNDKRLVFNSTDKAAAGIVNHGPGLYAVDRDGGDFRQLVAANLSRVTAIGSSRNLLPANTFLVPQVGRQDSDFIYVSSPALDNLGQLKHVNLLHLDTRTGRATTVERPADVHRWLLDAQGEPRIAIANDKNVQTVWYRDPQAGAQPANTWRKLVAFDTFQGGAGAFEPLAFAPDGTLYVTTDAGGDTQALHRFDLAANRVLPDAIVALKGYDFRGQLIATGDRLLGVRYLSDAAGTLWFDAAMKAVQSDVDAQRPGMINLIVPAPRAQTPYVLVESYSDQQPSRYALYNTTTKTFNLVGEMRPGLDASRMATQELMHYTARDGLTIPVWLTLPPTKNGKQLPMVVLVHGGPSVRGSSWGWHAEAQFLASRGYAVLEPEFRGSTGYGTKHARAGWKQWGLAMQNDIADGTRWAVAQGVADGKRVCIAGASYGGYAVLMGLVNDPDLYKCGVDWVGVTDIKLLATGHWSGTSDMTDVYREYGMPVLVGDIVKDAAQLQATSPLEQAARIKAPLLLAYGGKDVRVPLYHGSKFYDAVKATNPDVEWIVYPDEGHGWHLPADRIDFWGRVEKFLDRNIGH